MPDVPSEEHCPCTDGVKVLREAQWPDHRRKFPSALMPNKRDRQAVLTNMACRFATGFVGEFISGMLRGQSDRR